VGPRTIWLQKSLTPPPIGPLPLSPAQPRDMADKAAPWSAACGGRRTMRGASLANGVLLTQGESLAASAARGVPNSRNHSGAVHRLPRVVESQLRLLSPDTANKGPTRQVEAGPRWGPRRASCPISCVVARQPTPNGRRRRQLRPWSRRCCACWRGPWAAAGEGAHQFFFGLPLSGTAGNQ
jgi:hypothetical protein